LETHHGQSASFGGLKSNYDTQDPNQVSVEEHTSSSPAFNPLNFNPMTDVDEVTFRSPLPEKEVSKQSLAKSINRKLVAQFNKDRESMNTGTFT